MIFWEKSKAGRADNKAWAQVEVPCCFTGSKAGEVLPQSTFTDEEKATYFYYYAKDKDKAKEYLKLLKARNRNISNTVNAETAAGYGEKTPYFLQQQEHLQDPLRE